MPRRGPGGGADCLGPVGGCLDGAQTSSKKDRRQHRGRRCWKIWSAEGGSGKERSRPTGVRSLETSSCRCSPWGVRHERLRHREHASSANSSRGEEVCKEGGAAGGVFGRVARVSQPTFR